MGNDQQHWDERYREGPHSWSETDPFLPWAYQQFVAPRFPAPGSALDAAGGMGRHALWLAERGWRVKLIDISEVGVAGAEQKARELGLKVDSQVADLKATDLGSSRYDLVLVFFFLERELFPALMRALKPNGLLLYRTYTLEQLRFSRGPKDPAHLLKPGELREAFAALGMNILHYRETVDDKAAAELVAQAP